MTPEQIRKAIHQILTDQYLWECDEIENSLVGLVEGLVEANRAEVARLQQERESVRREALLEVIPLICTECVSPGGGNLKLQPGMRFDLHYPCDHGFPIYECPASPIRRLLADQG